MSIATQLQQVQDRIRRAAVACGRDPSSVKLVVVGKTHPAPLLREAVLAGASDLGENYIQEARQKIAALADLAVRWHFIGHSQTNKARVAVGLFHLIHTVDSVRLAIELDKAATKIGKRQDVLIEVNSGDQPSKTGIAADQAMDLAATIKTLANLNLLGLMTMPPFFDDPQRARPFFAALRALRDKMAAALNADLPELSMGMSADVEAAIAEEATIVRVGTAIFGQRG